MAARLSANELMDSGRISTFHEYFALGDSGCAGVIFKLDTIGDAFTP
jgi:hypothetical protein